ncbi:MAG: hypothetical protein ACLR4A_14090 [Christensenellales bacterium]
MSVINFGGILTNVCVPDRNGVLDDVVLGFDNLASYLAEHGSMGDTVGRYGNRIAQARFTIDGVTYQLDANNHGNHLHGVLGKQLWDADPVETAVGDPAPSALRQPRRRGQVSRYAGCNRNLRLG